MSYRVIFYRNDQNPAALLEEAKQRRPEQHFMLIPIKLASLLGKKTDAGNQLSLFDDQGES